ncbi:pimelyl-ACP methyl ester esterase BioV [Sulfurospirillum arsenophilum]|uniref:pimelyl-ACP methyl ester esterase BioV n=1 Tax=Sulfurospirillum arsenophilum TaxID=56698 RepID=UPI0005A763A6|nr:pimelyl-ACP methyl ester esterase BioV [Sulfurospirillum arsenophilum]
MKFFSGFCLANEQELFTPYLNQSDFTVAGFSYGAIKAFEYALTCNERIDTLQLFSPAFFGDKDAKFKKLQTLSFSKNSEAYTQNFMQNITYPSTFDMQPYFQQGSIEELNELLNYTWNEANLQALKKRGINIEVYVGENDTIINSLHVKDLFVPFASVYYFKRVGHILK